MKLSRQHCPYCGRSFVPSPYRPHQRVCSATDCQRRRRADYHRRKRQTDPVYHQVCLESQKQWRAAHPEYQRRYRQSHPQCVEQNLLAQQRRDRKQRLQYLVKNNLALDVKHLPGEVWMIGPQMEDFVKNNVAISQVLIFQTDSWSASPTNRS